MLQQPEMLRKALAVDREEATIDSPPNISDRTSALAKIGQCSNQSPWESIRQQVGENPLKLVENTENANILKSGDLIEFVISHNTKLLLARLPMNDGSAYISFALPNRRGNAVCGRLLRRRSFCLQSQSCTANYVKHVSPTIKSFQRIGHNPIVTNSRIERE